MDFSAGKTALLQAMTLLKEENGLTMKISDLLKAIEEDKSRTMKSFCEVLALQSQEAEKKKKVAELLDEVSKWWRLLVDDREKLLLTIANLELEKESILKKKDDPKEIYANIINIEASLKQQRFKLEQSISSTASSNSFNHC